MSYLVGIIVGLMIITWAESDRLRRVSRPLSFQESFDSLGLIAPTPMENWDRSFVATFPSNKSELIRCRLDDYDGSLYY